MTRSHLCCCLMVSHYSDNTCAIILHTDCGFVEEPNLCDRVTITMFLRWVLNKQTYQLGWLFKTVIKVFVTSKIVHFLQSSHLLVILE